MKNRLFGSAILAITLVLGMTVLGCEEDGGGDDWVDVTDIAQLDGTWKETISGTNSTEEGITRRYEIETTYTFNTNTNTNPKTLSSKQIMKETYSGSSSALNKYWNSMKTYFESLEGTNTWKDEDGYTYTITSNKINDSKYEITQTKTDEDGNSYDTSTSTIEIDDDTHTITQTGSATMTLTDVQIATYTSGIYQISKDGTKLRMGGMILYKQ